LRALTDTGRGIGVANAGTDLLPRFGVTAQECGGIGELCASAQNQVGWPHRTTGPFSLEPTMNLHLSLAPIVSLLAGILILVVPRLLNYIVAIYLIVIGLIGLFGVDGFHLR
jgi:Protein of unknown function (DUF3096)